MRTEEQTIDGCLAGSDGCTFARVDYPAVVGVPDGIDAERMKRAILELSSARYLEDGHYRSPRELVRAFLEEYRASRSQQPGLEQPWQFERKVFVTRSTPALVSLSVSERVQTGSARGVATLTFRNLDPASGRILGRAELLVDDHEKTLAPLVESRFRAARDIPEDRALADDGFVFPGEAEFALTENMGWTDSGIVFYYNAREVGPEELGPTEVVLRYDEIDELLRD